MKKILNSDLIRVIQQSPSVLVFTHFQPDGDAVGSALALYHLFSQMGKRTAVCCEDAPAGKFSFLPAIEVFRTPEEITGDFDLHLSIDASDLERLGTAAPLFRQGRVTAEIDHHATNDGFAMYNEVDSKAAAAGMLAMRLIKDLGVPLSRDMATCLYTAISTDTGNFCFPSVTGETFEMAGLLCDAGLELAPCARALHLMKTAGRMRLLGAALRTLHFIENGRISGMYITKEDFAACGALMEDGDGIVNYGLYIPGVEMAYLATEIEGGVKFSLRSIEPKKVSPVAVQFGGGGHAQASGCMIKAGMEEALNKIEAAMAAELNA